MKLSEKLRLLLANEAPHPLTVGMLLEQAGEQGFGLLSALLVIPMLIPWPIPVAGFSTLLGAGILLLGLQLVWGRQTPYFPAWLRRRQISPAVAQVILNHLGRILQPLERLTQPRLLQFSRQIWPQRILGLCLAWNALLMGLPLPIPFTNLLPAYTILFLALGAFESDGLLILGGYGMTVVTTLFFGSLAGMIGTLWLKLVAVLSR
jgi:hypothetical protein